MPPYLYGKDKMLPVLVRGNVRAILRLVVVQALSLLALLLPPSPPPPTYFWRPPPLRNATALPPYPFLRVPGILGHKGLEIKWRKVEGIWDDMQWSWEIHLTIDALTACRS